MNNALLKTSCFENVISVLEAATLTIPENKWAKSGGKKGIHTEHLGFILADFQYMQRVYLGIAW